MRIVINSKAISFTKQSPRKIDMLSKGGWSPALYRWGEDQAPDSMSLKE